MESGARRAGADDLDIVTALAGEAIAELRELRGGELWSRRDARTAPLRDGFEHALESAAEEVVVGTIDGVVVGYAAAVLRPLHDEGVVGDLTDLYVLPDARGVGIGEAMMDEVIVWCEAHECVGVDSIALPGDRATKNFFESFGLVARAIRVHRRLDR